MTIDTETIRTWLQVLAVLGMPTASMIYTWIATRDKDNTQHIKAVEAVLSGLIAEHTVRLERLEGDAKHRPTHQDMDRLSERYNDLGRDLSRMAGELAQMNDNLRLLLHKTTQGN